MEKPELVPDFEVSLRISSGIPGYSPEEFASRIFSLLQKCSPEELRRIMWTAIANVTKAGMSTELPKCNVFANAFMGVPLISGADTCQAERFFLQNGKRWAIRRCNCGDCVFPASGDYQGALVFFEHQYKVAVAAGVKNVRKTARDIAKRLEKLRKRVAKKKTCEYNVARLSVELAMENPTFTSPSLELLARVMQFTGCYPSSLPTTPHAIGLFLAKLQIVIDYFGPGVTRPTRTTLTDAFLSLVDMNKCPANVAQEIAEVGNIHAAWERVIAEIKTHNDYKPLYKLRDTWLNQATEVAQLICRLIEEGRVKPDYITCLGCRSSGEVQLLNALSWFLNVLRKKLRRVCSVLSQNPKTTPEDVCVWELVMSLPPGVRMLDIPVYTWAERLSFTMYKHNKQLQLHNIFAGRVALPLEKFMEMVTETRKLQQIPDDEVIPLAELTRAQKMPVTTEFRREFLTTLGALGIKSGDYFRSAWGDKPSLNVGNKSCEKCTASGASAASAASASAVPLCTCLP